MLTLQNDMWRKSKGSKFWTVIVEDVGPEEPNVKLHGEVGPGFKSVIEGVICEFEDVLDGRVGHYKDGEAKIVVNKDVQPRSHKPHRLPETLKDKVEQTVRKFDWWSLGWRIRFTLGGTYCSYPQARWVNLSCVDYCSLKV